MTAKPWQLPHGVHEMWRGRKYQYCYPGDGWKYWRMDDDIRYKPSLKPRSSHDGGNNRQKLNDPMGDISRKEITYAKDCRAWFREAESSGSRLSIRSGQLPIAVIPIWARIEPVCLSADLIPGSDSRSARRDANIEPAYPI